MKKNPQADLRRKYTRTVELGMVLSLFLTLVLFFGFRNWGTQSEMLEVELPEIQVEEVPPTEQIKRPPPPARPSVAVPTDDEDIPEDETIDITEINFDEIPEPPPPPQADESSNIFVAYDEAPEPIGGFGAIQRNLEYPEIARKAGIEGRVIVNVLVDVDGSVVETKILKSLGHSGCDEAAVKAIRTVKWKPAKQRDRPVKVWVGIPVIFKLK
ncbi:MAG: energy transducer TonB [Deferribacteres bacterium]|nr:energy transducer TonB [candidate division KSB1 bacterium]MCB9509428.1 energy transducer TonB [Deferribacteres bacterium]